jgi:DNA-binding beta-propeller fold protein YncE
VRLRDQYDGSNVPFEGDRTIVWRSLPADALVIKATLTLAPILPPGASAFTETLRFGPRGPSFGATIQKVATSILEVNFHARRAATAISPSVAGAQSLSVDIGGGVFLAVGADGTVPAPQGSNYTDFSNGVLPGIAALRLRLASATLPSDLFSVAIDIASTPSNLTLRFGKLPPFWARSGDLSDAVTTPDITNSVQRAIADATVAHGFYAIPLVVHSDTLGRVAITLEVEYLGTSSLVGSGLREVLLPYDYASVPTTDPNALRAILPAGAIVVSPQTALQVRGAYDASRVAYGPTGTTAESTTIRCSATETIAQPLIPGTDTNVTAADLFVAADGPAARLAFDLREDFDGKPAQASVLAKAVPFDLTGDATGQRRWTNVPLPAPALLKQGKRYWVILEAIDGAAFLGVDTPPAPDRLIQRSTDSGFSWRAAGLASPLLLRLRSVPVSFTMPIDFVAGAGAQAQRVSLAAYNALGKVDAVIDRPEIASAIQSYVAQTIPAPCAAAELLANPDFMRWTAQGAILGALEPVSLDSSGSLMLLDTFFDTLVTAFSPSKGSPRALTYSPDGTALYVAVDDGIAAVDTATLAVTPLIANQPAVVLAADPRGRRLYALDDRSGRLTAIELSTKRAESVFSFQDGGALAISPDGTRVYVAGKSELLVYNLVTGTERYRLTVAATHPALALSPDGRMLAAIDQTKGIVATFDAASGTRIWSAPLPQPQAPTETLVPQAVSFASDGTNVYAVGIPTTGVAGTGGPAPVLHAFDGRGRLRQSIALPNEAGTASIAVKPQGDRIYVAGAALAVDPGGSRLAVSGGDTEVARVAVGYRRPVNWALTAGQVAPQPSSGNPARIQARLSSGSLSQVVTVAPGCSHDFTVVSLVDLAAKDAPAADAVAEIFWLNATGGLLRGDSVTLPPSANFVTQCTRFTPPERSAQAEVRVRAAGGDCVLQTVSLKTTDALLRDDAWQPDPGGSALLAITQDATGTTYRNLGTTDSAVMQRAELTAAGNYSLDFAGLVIAGAANTSPSIAITFQNANGAVLGAGHRITLDLLAFAGQPAQIMAPPSSAAVTIRIILPAGGGLAIERLSLVSQPTVAFPCSFIAQSPGQLHVSNAHVVYDTQAAPPPQPPPGGLSNPTPPETTPGNSSQTCACNGAQQTGTAREGKPTAVLPAPMAMRTTAPVSLTARASEQPLIAVKGIGPARERRLVAAGIARISDLAVATPEAVAKALGGPAGGVELGRTLIEEAKSLLRRAG